MTKFSTAFVVAAAVGLLSLATPGMAQTVAYKADLTGAAESPATDSKGQGTAMVDFDSANKTLSWTITFTDLSGPVTAAHFHGPAAAGENAPPVIPIEGALVSPIKGSATLTDGQVSDLEAGKLYFNLHTAKYPDGEVRGQVTK